MTILRVARGLAVAMVLAALVAGIRLVSRGPLDVVPVRVGDVALGLRLDVLSVVLLGFVGCVGALVAAYSARNLVGQARTGRFGWLLLTALTSLTVLVAGASLPVIAAGWTVSGMALAALVAQPGTESSRRAAGYVRRTLLVGDAAVWVAVALALVLLPTVNRAELARVELPGVGSTIVAALLIVGCVVRSALVPAQSWLPETAEAPSPISAFLHAGIVNGAGVLVCLVWPLFVAAPAVLLVLLVVGSASVVFGTVAARARADVKGRLACSTTAQMGYMAVQLGLGLPAAAVLHLVGHGFYKAWLFLRAGGAVNRERWQPTGPVVDGAVRRIPAAAGSAALALLVAAALAWRPVSDSIARLGPAAVMPLLMAGAAAVLAAGGVARRRDVTARVAAGVAVTVAVAVAAYAWVLTGAEGLLSPALPQLPLWPGPLAAALVVGVVGVGAVTVLLVRSTAADPAGWWAVRFTGSALPPWTRRVSGTAAWPTPDVGLDRGCTALDASQARHLVQTAASVCAPAWPLRTLVAANPLANLELFAFDDAAAMSGRLFGTRGYLPASAYRRLYAEGRITGDHLRAAARQRWVDQDQDYDEADLDTFVGALVADLHAAESEAGGRGRGAAPRFTDLAELGRGRGVGLAQVADDHAALWCQRAWSRALDDSNGPWQLWRRAASTPGYDRTVGLARVSARVREIPDDPAQALGWMLDRAGVPSQAHVAYVCALLTAAPGWAGHAAWRARQSGHSGPLLELVALRAALDLLLAGSAAATVDYPVGGHPDASVGARGWAQRRGVWQAAYELGFRQPLVDQIQARALAVAHTGQGSSAPARTIAAQLVFCIDVRSERLRRALEGTGPYATFGFAGFFGAVLSYRTPQGATFEQCPALVRPGFTVTARTPERAGLRQGLRAATLAVSAAPVTPLLLAEAGGALSGIAGLAQTLVPAQWHRVGRAWHASTDRWGPAELTIRAGGPQTPPTDGSPVLPVGLTTRQRAEVAGDVLRTLGLVDGFAPLLVICGHGATVENNAFAAAYDCGACGGNSGHVNARVLADILNDPDVRAALADAGITIPPTSLAVAAVHDTTTDEVSIDPHLHASSKQLEALARLQAGLAAAANAVRAERAALLPGVAAHPVPPAVLARQLRDRAGDWAQPFPEWGLAGNAAFVIGPRALTCDLDLHGRVFLHDYHPDLDRDDAILETILTAPTIVTQWINAQYYASTVDHEVFGAGDKATHNVVGDVGVLTGAHGDLRLGLPWQALFAADPRHHPDTAQHEPLRQLVLAWASPAAIIAIVRRHQVIQSLIGNDWMTLAAIDPDTGTVHRLTPHLTWQPWCRPSSEPPPSATRGQNIPRPARRLHTEGDRGGAASSFPR